MNDDDSETSFDFIVEFYLLMCLPDSYAMLMRAYRTAVYGCHCPGDMALHMHEVLAILWNCVV